MTLAISTYSTELIRKTRNPLTADALEHLALAKGTIEHHVSSGEAAGRERLQLAVKTHGPRTRTVTVLSSRTFAALTRTSPMR